jgi:hypothetical protein
MKFFKDRNEIDLTNQEFEVNEVIDQMIQIISMAAKQKVNKNPQSACLSSICHTYRRVGGRMRGSLS